MNMAAVAIHNPRPSVTPDHEVIIIGAGISGIGAAIQLRADGIKDILILERSKDVGGTWRDNSTTPTHKVRDCSGVGRCELM